VDVDALGGHVADVVFGEVANFAAEHQSVDGDHGLTGVGLHGCSHETLREEEGRYPVRVHCASVYPFPEEGDSFDEIGDPRTKWLERWITKFS
jgi:hypothetical protein